MLRELNIENFVLLEKANISFNDKLTVITGETGAGKSVIVGAVNLVLGGQLKGDVALNKDKTVILESTFDYNEQETELKKLAEQYDLDISDNEIFFRREIKPDGKSQIFINGKKTTNSIVKEFRNALFDFHSQRDQQLLFDNITQLLYLDQFADLNEQREKFNQYFQKYQSLTYELKKQNENIKRLEEKKLLFEYQIAELDSAKLNINEEAELDKEHHLLLNAKEILETFDNIRLDFTESEITVRDKISFYKNKLESFKQDNKLISDTIENLNTCLAAIDDVILCSRYIDQEIFIDEQRLENVENRIKVLFDLKNKYKKNIPDMIEYTKEMKNFLQNYNQLSGNNKNLETEISKTKDICKTLADDLSMKRNNAANKFSDEICLNLKKLAINDACFKIVVDKIYNNYNITDQIDSYNNYGQDSVTFMFSANKGMPLQDIKVAISGGELSRLLLVIKSLLANKLSKRTIIFDEIDSGIGGITANMLGNYIKNLSEKQQIICITHLPQVASLGHNHLKIEKSLKDDKNQICISRLSEKNRVNEIARMLSGEITETSLEHANELLNR